MLLIDMGKLNLNFVIDRYVDYLVNLLEWSYEGNGVDVLNKD